MEEKINFLFESVKKLAEITAGLEDKTNEIDSRLTDIENMLN